METMNFLPTTLEEAACRGWRELDIIFVSGDAYIDHPAFGVPLLARLMEARGFRVGIIAQPDWRSPDAFTALGRPRLFFAVSAGAMDSMVAHYTPARKLRHDDAYTPGNRHGARPNRATLVYTARLKELFRGVPVVIGGIEASLRRFAHYDFWENKIRRSILFDAKADLLIYGMGERPLLEVAERLRDGEAVRDLKDIRGTACAEPASAGSSIAAARVMLPSWEEVAAEPAKFNQAFVQVSREQNPWSGKVVLQPHGDRHLVVNAPSLPLSQEELDELYSLPFVREPHPSYREQIPAFEQIKTSITTHRGCYGGCAFCAITHHQGKAIQSRSASSVVGEIKVLTGKRWFRGTVSDVGGPTANMYGTSCADPVAQGACRRGSCLYPSPCKHLRQSGARGAELLRQVRRVNGVKLVTVCSGIRYDLLAQQPEYFRELLAHHVGGLLKVAPEHLSTSVVNLMRKPGPREFELFLARFREESELLGRVQYVVPYLMSGHPGCTLADMADLALLLKKHRLRVEQVQDFTPTPGTLATCMYYTGSDPFTGQAVYVARGDKEKSLQKALLLAHLPDQRQHVLQALKACGRMAVAQELLPPVGSRNVGRAEKGVRGMGGKEVVPTTKVPGPRIKKR